MRIISAFLPLFIACSAGCSDETINARSPAGLFDPKGNIDANAKRNDSGPSKSDKQGLTNNGSPLAAIKLKEGLPELPAGTRTGWVALGVYQDKSTRILNELVKWDVSDKSKATLTTSPPGTLLAKSSGTVELTAALGRIKGSVTMKVTDAYIMSLSLIAEKLAVPVGGNGTYVRAEGRFSDNQRYDVTPAVTFASGRPRIAEVSNAEDNKGFVRGRDNGLVTITATHPADMSAEVSIRISAPTAWSLHIMGGSNVDPMPGCFEKEQAPKPPSGRYKKDGKYIAGDIFTGFARIYFSDCDYETSSDIEWEIISGGGTGDFGAGPLKDNELALVNAGSVTVRAHYGDLVSDEYEFSVDPLEVAGLFLSGQTDNIDPARFDHCRSTPAEPQGDSPEMKVDDPDTGTKDLRLYVIQNNCKILPHTDQFPVTWKSSETAQADFMSAAQPHRVTALAEGKPEVWAELTSNSAVQSGKFKLDIAPADLPDPPDPSDPPNPDDPGPDKGTPPDDNDPDKDAPPDGT